MKETIITSSGKKVYKNYLDNISCPDKSNGALTQKADTDLNTIGKATGLSRIGNAVSEDALSWSVFRTLEFYKKLNLFLNLLDIHDNIEHSIFWTGNTRTEIKDKTLEVIIDEVEPRSMWPTQQTEPDIILVCQENLIFIEAKLGEPDKTVLGWARKNDFTKKQNHYKQFLDTDFNKDFINSFSTVGKRYYQLMRNIIVGRLMANKLKKKFTMVALVNPLSKPQGYKSHESKFIDFLKYLKQPEITKMVTWQDIEQTIPDRSKELTDLKSHLKNHACLS